MFMYTSNFFFYHYYYSSAVLKIGRLNIYFCFCDSSLNIKHRCGFTIQVLHNKETKDQTTVDPTRSFKITSMAIIGLKYLATLLNSSSQIAMEIMFASLLSCTELYAWIFTAFFVNFFHPERHRMMLSESHPVMVNSSAGVCCLNVFNKGNMLQFGKDDEYQSLHSDRHNLKHTSQYNIITVNTFT